MAQGKVVDYNLLLAAGAATVKPVSKEKETVFTKFLNKGAEYLVFQQAKTAEFIAAMPDVNMEKVDDKLLDKTTEFLSARRDEIVSASEIMTWYGKKSQKYKDAVISYNNATNAIINYNKNLDLLLTTRTHLIEIDGKYDSYTSQSMQTNSNEIVNGTMLDKMTILDNGNIQMNGYLDTNPASESFGLGIDKLLTEYKAPDALDMSLNDAYRQAQASILQLKEEGQSENFDINQNGHVSNFAQILDNATDGQILDMLSKGTLFGSEGDETLMELFLTDGYGSINNENRNSYDEDIFTTTDSFYGLGYDKGSDEYKAAVEILKSGNLSEDIKVELRQFINKHFQAEFEAYEIIKTPKEKIRKDPSKANFDLIMNKIHNKQQLDVHDVMHPTANTTVDGLYIYIKSGESGTARGAADFTNNTGKGGYFKVYYDAGISGYKIHSTRYGSTEIRDYMYGGQYQSITFTDATLEKRRSYTQIIDE